MARPLRMHATGMLHHVMSRGNDKREMFLDDGDYQRYLTLLERSAERFKVDVIGYCLMPNHVHLLLRPSTHPLSRLMQHVNSAYCGWFNRKQGRVGHVLQGRYKAQIVEGGPSFLRVLRYVLLNPVAAGLAVHPGAWTWSSFRHATGVCGPGFLALSDLWRTFDPEDLVNGQRQFKRFVETAYVPDDPANGLIVGSKAFIRGFQSLLQPHHATREIVCAERFAARPSLDELIANVDRGAALHEAARRAFHAHAFTLREIADHVGVSPSTIWEWKRRARRAA